MEGQDVRSGKQPAVVGQFFGTRAYGLRRGSLYGGSLPRGGVSRDLEIRVIQANVVVVHKEYTGMW